MSVGRSKGSSAGFASSERKRRRSMRGGRPAARSAISSKSWASLVAPSSLSIAGLFFGLAFLLVFGEGEDGEVDRAIFAVLCEVGELGEVIRAWVLYDDDTVALEEP